MRVMLFLMAMCSAIMSATPETPTMITVDVTHSLDIGGTLIKPTLFGITACEAFPRVVWDAAFRGKIMACRFGAILFPAPLAWDAPDHDDLTWYGRKDVIMRFEWRPLFGAQYPFGRFVRIVRALGAEPIPSLGAPPKWMQPDEPKRMRIGRRLPKDWNVWGRHCAEYLRLWRKFDPQLRYFQVWNEPNADLWMDAERCKAHGGMGGLFADFFNVTVKAIKAAHPNLEALGPVLCWPPAWPRAQRGKAPWYTWDEFSKPFIERTSETCDFFSYHAYDIDPAEIIVQTALVYAYSTDVRNGRPLLTWITESNYALRCEPSDWDDLQAEWERRALPYERYLLTLIDHQDMIEGNLYHDLQGTGRWCLFNRRGQETGVYGVFWILRNLRGRRLLATCADPSVRVVASAERERVTIIAFNDSTEPKRIHIRGIKPKGHYCRLAGAEILLPPPSKDVPPPRTRLNAQWEGDASSFTIVAALPPHATGAFYVYPIPDFPQRRVTSVRQYFGDELLQPLRGKRAAATVHLKLPADALTKGANVNLRIGLMAPTESESYRIRINGVERKIASTPLQELPANGLLRIGTNIIRITVTASKPNPSRALGFVAAVVRREM
jgi:hypothetical protein